MGVYLRLDTAGNRALALEILGYTEADVAAMKAIHAKYDPILDDQFREDWHEQFNAREAELNATPALAIADQYELDGFGNMRGRGLVPGGFRYVGSADGTAAVAILEAQVAFFDDHDYPHDGPLRGALARAMAAVRDGRAPGVCWF